VLGPPDFSVRPERAAAYALRRRYRVEALASDPPTVLLIVIDREEFACADDGGDDN
jgi:hypothetical protein